MAHGDQAGDSPSAGPRDAPREESLLPQARLGYGLGLRYAHGVTPVMS